MSATDRPDDAIINDDAALDKWYQGFVREQAIRAGKKTDVSMGSHRSQVPQFKGK